MWVPITLPFNSQVWPLHRQVIVGMTADLPKVLSTGPNCNNFAMWRTFFFKCEACCVSQIGFEFEILHPQPLQQRLQVCTTMTSFRWNILTKADQHGLRNNFQLWIQQTHSFDLYQKGRSETNIYLGQATVTVQVTLECSVNLWNQQQNVGGLTKLLAFQNTGVEPCTDQWLTILLLAPSSARGHRKCLI